MSQENVDVIRAFLDAYNARDIEAFGALHDARVIWAAFEGWPEAETLVGRDACMRQWERMRAAFDVDAVEPITEFIAAGDRVVVRVAWRAMGQGPEMSMELTTVYTVRKGKIFMIENFWEQAEALKALGLEE
ncbi:MAG TPA: nuclear transport factor 2 family protein [Solirubrobacteraceae bacterium]|nr:nuclear transport factor 2 family protein [Solirubrobacteraceae bacterium]